MQDDTPVDILDAIRYITILGQTRDGFLGDIKSLSRKFRADFRTNSRTIPQENRPERKGEDVVTSPGALEDRIRKLSGIPHEQDPRIKRIRKKQIRRAAVVPEEQTKRQQRQCLSKKERVHYPQYQRKYRLLKNSSIVVDGVRVYRIMRVSDGSLGGYLESDYNLSQHGNCWVGIGSCVMGNARVVCDAVVEDGAMVSGSAIVGKQTRLRGNTTVSDNAIVALNTTYEVIGTENNEVLIGGKAIVCGHLNLERPLRICDNAFVCGTTHLNAPYVVKSDLAWYCHVELGMGGTICDSTISGESIVLDHAKVRRAKTHCCAVLRRRADIDGICVLADVIEEEGQYLTLRHGNFHTILLTPNYMTVGCLALPYEKWERYYGFDQFRGAASISEYVTLRPMMEMAIKLWESLDARRGQLKDQMLKHAQASNSRLLVSLASFYPSFSLEDRGIADRLMQLPAIKSERFSFDDIHNLRGVDQEDPCRPGAAQEAVQEKSECGIAPNDNDPGSSQSGGEEATTKGEEVRASEKCTEGGPQSDGLSDTVGT